MPIFIELHLIAHFTLLLFVLLAVKIFLKTQANFGIILLASIMFAIIKFVLDFYYISLCLQCLIIFIYIIAVMLVVHKLNHISKLIVAATIFMFYYVCLVGINWAITTIILKQTVFFANNYFLFIIIGLNFILFSLFCVIVTYLQGENSPQLTHKCQLTIANSKIDVIGFLDTGNTLKEPKSGKCVVVVSLNSIKKHISNKMYADLLFASNSSGVFKDITKLKYTTISGTSYITIFTPQSFMVDNKPISCFIGVTTRAMKYDTLLSLLCV